MRIAYLILAHAHPQQLARLLARLQAPQVRCYLHIDANTPSAVHAEIVAAADRVASPDRVRFIARRPCRWGGYSLVAATLDLLHAARADGFDWAILLSGQDYPLVSHAALCERLATPGVAGWIDLHSAAEFDVGYRWQRWHPEGLHGSLAGKCWQRLQRAAQACGWQRRLPHPLQEIRAGSQWWMLSSAAVDTVLAQCVHYPAVPAFFRHTLVPDEMMFQTLLWHSPLREQLSGDPLRLIDWTPGAWSPRTLGLDDLPQLRRSAALFARKFAPDGLLAAALDEQLGIDLTVCKPRP
ncbi:beta-1,6-N-acetylglucosaminyltransferase [Chitinilyticum litopenaei]|uniref:beta-1,6-N-acetylglucosaminyltransferase n=1 Tax=Chitinilyticum litopenaei TaxID=1121276 RepID=UPI00041B6B25|nr:beta-1,6-N-acetylglucosaminyltransferase [Chitinilyticum litopenaei]